MTHWSTPYIGLPYLNHGRDRAGCDCWGLVVLVYRECLGIELPSYAGDYVSTDERGEIAELIAHHREVGPWQSVEDPREFDVAIFRRGPHASHAGIVVRPGSMLHVPFDQARIEDYRRGQWAPRLTGIYRHVERTSKVL
ncbi:MAG: phage tail protein [Stutzerimonas stutzeri]|nr:MAG: phage tail protein [Stutzerimonas stutzeri]